MDVTAVLSIRIFDMYPLSPLMAGKGPGKQGEKGENQASYADSFVL
jgi:hypothetical protein